MIVTTTDDIEGRSIETVLGLVMANSVRARNVGRDLMAALRNLAGGEIQEYTKLLADSREAAVQRMTERAEEVGGNAVVGVRFITAGIMGGAAEILAYGTAVILSDEE